MDLIARVRRHPQPGETLVGSEFGMYLGGKGFNQAIAAARSGAETALIGRLGNDPFGDSFLAALREEGVDERHITRDTEEGTGIGLPIVDDTGENTIVLVPRANGKVTVEDIEAAASVIRGASALLLQCELPLEASATAARIARDAGARIVVNAAPAAGSARLLRYPMDYLVVNELEALELTGSPGSDGARAAARDLLARCELDGVVLTLGSQGALALAEECELWFPPYRVPVIDSVGAGDAFCGAMAAQLALGASFEQAVRYGNAAGALAVTSRGAGPSMPKHPEVAALLNNGSSTDEVSSQTDRSYKPERT